MKSLILLLSLILLSSCNSDRVRLKGKDTKLSLYGYALWEVCINKQAYYHLNEGITIRLDANGKPIECK